MMLVGAQVTPVDTQDQSLQIQQLQQQIQIMQLQQQKQQLDQQQQQSQQQQFARDDLMMLPNFGNDNLSQVASQVNNNQNIINIKQTGQKVQEFDFDRFIVGTRRNYKGGYVLLDGKDLSKTADSIIQYSKLNITNCFKESKINLFCKTQEDVKADYVKALKDQNPEAQESDIANSQLVEATEKLFQGSKCGAYFYPIAYFIISIVLYVVYTVKVDALEKILINEKVERFRYENIIASGDTWWDDIPSEEGSKQFADMIKVLSLMIAIVQSLAAIQLIICSFRLNITLYKSSMWFSLGNIALICANFGAGFGIPFFSEPNYFGINMGTFMPLLFAVGFTLMYQRMSYRKIKRIMIITGCRPTNFIH